jgi:hypothetical protein
VKGEVEMLIRRGRIPVLLVVIVISCGFAAAGAAPSGATIHFRKSHSAAIKTGVTIHYKRSRGLYGFVFSPRPRCTERAIHIFKQKGKSPNPERDKVMGTVFAYKKNDRYKWHQPPGQRIAKGKYYAMMRKSRDRDARGCEPDYSRTIHVKHPYRPAR